MPEKNNLNDQISDSIAVMQKLMSETKEENVMAIAYQIMAHAAGLAMLNAVNQQQQMYILQNAATAATAKAALDKNPEEAIKIINASLNNNTMLETFNGLKNFIDDLNKTYGNFKKGPAETNPKGTKAKNKKGEKSKPDNEDKQE